MIERMFSTEFPDSSFHRFLFSNKNARRNNYSDYL